MKRRILPHAFLALCTAALIPAGVLAGPNDSPLGADQPHYQVLYTFQGGADGAGPVASVVRDKAGNLYGTAEYGGDLNCGFGTEPGCGVMFKLTPAGSETVLSTFRGGTDGAFPTGTLARDAAGNLYGTTLRGGGSGCEGSGCGTVFWLDTGGKRTVLHRFGKGTDGQLPFAGVVRDATGGLYGTAESGGSGCGGSGCGMVFEIDANRKETVLHEFKGGTDGADPEAGVILGSAGTLYGTSREGGGSGCNGTGCGTVYKLDQSGKETILHRFHENDGGLPHAAVIRDRSGNLYGLCAIGGPGGWGTVFRLNRSGKESILYGFKGGEDGGSPEAGLVMDAAGNFYGATPEGGANNFGAIFKLDQHGKETVLYSFTGGTDGAYPEATLVRDEKGNLYGTAIEGGVLGGCGGPGCGVVFKLTP